MTESENPTSRRRSKALNNNSASYNERKREIAQVAAELFNKRGFKGTSLSAIAEALGTDRASLYYYVADKRELFDEVVREAAEGQVVMAEELLQRDLSPLDKLRTLMVALMSSYAAHYPLLYVHMRENLTHVESGRTDWSQYMRSLNRRYEDVFIRIIQTGIDEGSIRSLSSARVLAFGLIGMIGWTNRWFVPGRTPESAESIGTAYAEMIMGGLALTSGIAKSP